MATLLVQTPIKPARVRPALAFHDAVALVHLMVGEWPIPVHEPPARRSTRHLAPKPVATGDTQARQQRASGAPGHAHSSPAAAVQSSQHDLSLGNRILDYAEGHFHLPFHLAEMASALDRNPSYLSSVFSRQFGTTFHRHLESLRLSQAKALLRDPDRPICDVAYAVGYADANYFRQAFKRRTGSSPSAWRYSLAAIGSRPQSRRT